MYLSSIGHSYHGVDPTLFNLGIEGMSDDNLSSPAKKYLEMQDVIVLTNVSKQK